jgi:pimeloyl-ACP methyl ester carboxylesterase
MAVLNRTHLSDLRGATRLAFDATAGLVGVVERMHSTVQRRPPPVGAALNRPTKGITGLVYRSVRGGVRLIGAGVDVSLASVVMFLPQREPPPGREALRAAVNGVYGDHLVRTGNPLAIEMSLRARGRAVDVTDPGASYREADGHVPTSKLLVLVHGLCLNELHWRRAGHDHGAALADEFGYSPLYVRYNSGLHIRDNGRALAALLESLVRNWPVAVQELCIIGHSMGGLVARSACWWADEHGHDWLSRLGKLVFLGTPHQGAPLERGGNGLDFILDLSPYSAPLTRLGKTRSAGIQDLRYGAITADGLQSVPLPAGVACYAAAATLGKRRSLLADRLIGDGLVPLNSALGRHRTRSRALRIPKTRQWIGYEMGHLELLCRPEVYAQLRIWLQDHA